MNLSRESVSGAKGNLYDRGQECRTAILSAFEFTSYVIDSLQARFQVLQFCRPDPDHFLTLPLSQAHALTHITGICTG
ncbi:MAG: hypothetical protein H0U49_12995 [Parachlamydiaceae bacterium]|nr:hypothetical protein [Parachlamydiaceae bacterium]